MSESSELGFSLHLRNMADLLEMRADKMPKQGAESELFRSFGRHSRAAASEIDRLTRELAEYQQTMRQMVANAEIAASRQEARP